LTAGSSWLSSSTLSKTSPCEKEVMSFASGIVWMVLARAREGEAGRDSGLGSRRVKERETWRGRGLGACFGEDELDIVDDLQGRYRKRYR
jgi:hypothetical protein